MDTLDKQITHNKRQSWITIITFIFVINIFIALFSMLPLLQDENSPVTPDANVQMGAAIFAMSELFLFGYVAYKYWRSGQDILRMNKGEEIFENDDREKLRQVYHIVEELSLASGLPMPKVYLVPDYAPNAFATGMTPEKSSIAVTSGLVNIMNREELEGVISHEMSHIKNLDIRTTTLAIALSGFISTSGYALLRFGEILLRSTHFDDVNDDKSSGLTLAALGLGGGLFLIGGFILIFGVPISILLTKLLSRKREALADASGADLTGNPEGLISAFKKLQRLEIPSTVIKGQTASLCLVQPLSGNINKDETGELEITVKKTPWYKRMLDDHPPLEVRIKNLEKLL